MKRNFWRRQLPLALITGGLVCTIAWQTHPASPQHIQQTVTDTVPDKQIKAKDIDEALENIKQGRIEVEQSLKNMDWSEVQKSMNEALKQVNADKIRLQIDQAMKELDVAKMQAEALKGLKEVDMEKIKSELDKEMAKVDKEVAQIDKEKIKAELDKAMKQIDMEKVRMNMDEAMKNIDAQKLKAQIQELDMKKMQEQMEHMRPNMEKSMAGAREGLDRAEKELRNYKALIDALDHDGLINKKDHYTIEYKSDVLIINGKTQSAETTKKYSQYLKQGSDIKITD